MFVEKSKVYFIKGVTEENLVKVYDALGIDLKGKTAVKLHSGEDGNQNYVRPLFVKSLIDKVSGTVAECNTAYSGARNSTSKHEKLMEKHGWTKYFDVDILDSEGPDLVLDIPFGHVIKKDYVGGNIKNYDSMLVLSHFKGHPMGGYGGALKQLSIGVASSRGKAWIHSAGRITDQSKLWDNLPSQDMFLESMADAAFAVHREFEGNIAYVNIMCNMSVDCDCCAVAEDPCMKDIGILASADPIAIDQACIDIVYNSDDEGKSHLIERIESRNGIHTIEAASELGFGSREYELITIE